MTYALSNGARIREWGKRRIAQASKIDCRLIALLLAVAFFAVSCLDIATYPLVSDDEGILNDPGLQLVHTGQFRSDVLKANPGFNDHYLLQPPGLALSAAISYEAFGFGIWQTRLPSILFGATGIALAFLFVFEITQQLLPSLLAATSLSVWPAWALTAKSARMDTGAICFLLLASILAFRGIANSDPFSLRRPFLVGLCVSVASLFHTASFTWALALLFTLLIFSREPTKHALAYCAGACLFVGGWLAYGLIHFHEFQQQYLEILPRRAAESGLFERLFLEGERYVAEFRRIPTIAILIALAAIGFRADDPLRRRSKKALITLTGILVIANALIAGKGSGFYTLYPMTLVLCVLSVGAASFIKGVRMQSTKARWFAVVAIVIFFANLSFVTYGPRALAYAYQRNQRNYFKAFAPFSKVVQPGDQVWGSGTAWYAAVAAGARLDVQPYGIPLNWDSKPDPRRHKWVVVPARSGPESFDGYTKIETFGTELPHVFGSQLADKSYLFTLWKSDRLK